MLCSFRAHVVLYRGLEKSLSERHGARYGHGMTSVIQTRPRCVNQMEKTQSKPPSGTAWAPRAMCELAVRSSLSCVFVPQQCGLTLSNLCILEFKCFSILKMTVTAING